MKNTFLRRALTAGGAVTGTAALLLAGIPAASAHVSVNPDKTSAGSYALLTFGIPHGCDNSATTKVAISLPEELADATPTVNSNWTVEKLVQTLPEPKKLADGTSITKRTSQIVYTAKAPLDPHLRDTFVLSVKLPDAAGKTLYFPTLQSCQQGQTDWSEIPKEGQDPHSLKAPAPSVAVTAAASEAGEGHGATNSGATVHSGTEQASSVSSSGAEARSWIGLIAGVAGLGLGGLALFRRARSTQPAGASQSSNAGQKSGTGQDS
ncbi:YcnI family protein [Arthrobacter sp. M4]|uniref:YcnI family copper-binding membrane protein n=1 Tax=Arthrobacter sp. M4 TaxID=218160 RepID=UPI001CDD6F9F|nr:YcnI family protein [Arthrobacter sp. M4]MCA4134412.1 YcnI family protein [Arthrobacter sp. M4]